MSNKGSPFRPTQEDRSKVKGMIAVGIPPKIVARRFGISEEELHEQFERELQTALPEMRAMGSANLFASAKAGNPAAVFFWLKTRAGWSETTYLSAPEPDEDPVNILPEQQVRIFIPCNSRDWCTRIELWVPYLEKLLQELLGEEAKR